MRNLTFEAMRSLRVLDANANRAAEGLRTLEDYARLFMEDAVAADWIKSLRHRLAAIVAQLDRPERLAARSTETDAGTDITTPAELRRDSARDIVSAATERVTQAIRGLEEYSKLLSATTSDAFKQLRYEAYDVLARIELRFLTVQLPSSAQLYLLMDCDKSVDDFVSYLIALAEAGVDLFQLRDKRAIDAKLLNYAKAAVEALRASGARLIVNDRVDIALASGAAGVHLGQDDISPADARRLSGSSFWIGVSTHNLEQAIAAEQAGADYIGCGPTFPSITKSFDQFPGTEFLRQVITQVSLPLFAIGGVDHSNVQAVLDAGCSRVAVSSVIHRAADPTVAARGLKGALKTARLAN